MQVVEAKIGVPVEALTIIAFSRLSHQVSDSQGYLERGSN
jgi:hypothetical protein